MRGSFWCGVGLRGRAQRRVARLRITPGTVSPPMRLRPNSRPSMDRRHVHRTRHHHAQRFVQFAVLDDFLGTKPMAPLSMARITSLARSEADTTTTGTAG
jgi:hypothetical protein